MDRPGIGIVDYVLTEGCPITKPAMKRFVIMLLLLMPLAVTAQSDLYRRYASMTEYTVAQVSGFKINDSVRIDVVMVQSDNDKDWYRLSKMFGVEQATGVTSWLGAADHPEHRVAWTGEPVIRVVASHDKRTIGLYRIDNEAQYDALMEYQVSAMSSRKKRQ